MRWSSHILDIFKRLLNGVQIILVIDISFSGLNVLIHIERFKWLSVLQLDQDLVGTMFQFNFNLISVLQLDQDLVGNTDAVWYFKWLSVLQLDQDLVGMIFQVTFSSSIRSGTMFAISLRSRHYDDSLSLWLTGWWLVEDHLVDISFWWMWTIWCEICFLV